MLSVGRPDNTLVRTGLSSLIRLTRSDNYIKCNKKIFYPIILMKSQFDSKILKEKQYKASITLPSIA